jgi:hypothetical protein
VVSGLGPLAQTFDITTLEQQLDLAVFDSPIALCRTGLVSQDELRLEVLASVNLAAARAGQSG